MCSMIFCYACLVTGALWTTAHYKQHNLTSKEWEQCSKHMD